MYIAKIHVSLKPSVLDPQGSTVTHSLHALGYDEVADVRIGKFMQVTIQASTRDTADQRIKEMCEKLLVNTVIETYSYELVEA